jgi:arylformamidase
MKIYDVTVAVSESVPIYKSDPTVQVTMAKSIANGSSANVSQLCCGVHTGTHVDAPNHFIDGTRRVHELDVAKLIGPWRSNPSIFPISAE